MRGRAFAKVNLSLEITAKRADGYHELVSVMQTISLADVLSLEPADELSLKCSDPSLEDDDNLVIRAARMLGRGGRFVLEKHVPVAGGLGGGSSDAALALRLLDAVYGLDLPQAVLFEAAAKLGSDVPFFLHGGTAVAEGRGERVAPLPDLPERWLVLMNPNARLSTAAVYGELQPAEYDSGETTRTWLGQAAAAMPPPINSLAAPACRLEPGIQDCLSQLRHAGVETAMVSGSGPTCFGLAASQAEAEHSAAEVSGAVARFVTRDEALTLDL